MRHQRLTLIQRLSLFSRTQLCLMFQTLCVFSHNVIPSNSLHSLTKHIIRERKVGTWRKPLQKRWKKKKRTLRRNESQTNLIRYRSRYSCNAVCSVIVSTCSRLRDRAGRLAEALAMVKPLSVTVTVRPCRAPGFFTAQVPHQQITHNTPRGFPRLTESSLLFVTFSVNRKRDKSHRVFSQRDSSWTPTWKIQTLQFLEWPVEAGSKTSQGLHPQTHWYPVFNFI